MATTAPSLSEALRHGEEAAAALRAARNQRYLAALQASLAYTALVQSEYSTADRLSTEALAAAEAYDDPYLLALALGNVGLARLFTGRPEQGHAAFIRELRLLDLHGYDILLFEALSGIAAVAAAQLLDQVAATLTGAADATALERHDPSIMRQLDTGFFAPARSRLGERAWQSANAAGSALDRRNAIDAALRSLPLRAVA